MIQNINLKGISLIQSHIFIKELLLTPEASYSPDFISESPSQDANGKEIIGKTAINHGNNNFNNANDIVDNKVKRRRIFTRSILSSNSLMNKDSNNKNNLVFVRCTTDEWLTFKDTKAMFVETFTNNLTPHSFIVEIETDK